MIAKILIVAGLLAAVFGYWGVYTESGRREFDEMAGIIPMFALWCGLACAVIGAAVAAFRR